MAVTLSDAINPPSPAVIRDELQRLVLADLLGPQDGPEEVVDETLVRDRYLVGMLAPQGQTRAAEAEQDLSSAESDGEDGTTEGKLPAGARFLPSSMGLTFAVNGDATTLRVTARWGRYERTTVEEDAYRRPDGSYRRVWKRASMGGTTNVTLQEGNLFLYPGWPPAGLDQPDVYVRGIARRHDNRWMITLFLVNGQSPVKKGADRAWVFQPELVVEAPDGSAIFECRPLPRDSEDFELETLAMLYRRQVEFAVGHGVSVHVDPPGAFDRAVRLSTTFAPAYEVGPTTQPAEDDYPLLAGLILDMRALADTPDGEFASRLQPLVAAYSGWIDDRMAQIEADEPDLRPYRDAAREAVDAARSAVVRIQAGIDLLDRDNHAARAFRFANNAMALQRQHTVRAQEVRRGGTPNEAAVVPAAWRVFQLAFILLNLPGITDLASPERSVPLADESLAPPMLADLLWFPTGGGKTEAYLGLAAYTMALRRLQGSVGGRSGEAGVAVLMRYTLRLLTLQQFQRAATLICACEILRREDEGTWGKEPFRIGLWVGRRTTPNYTRDSSDAVHELRDHQTPSGGSPHQLTNCPWCGHSIDPTKDIVVETPDHGRGRTLVYCGNPMGDCPFSRLQSEGEGLPILTVDEEVYRRLPALLIATVDKFARMPWDGRTAMLFGQVNGYCPRHGYTSPDIDDTDHQKKGRMDATRLREVGPLRPPDLIIQDELHLISGPLGTLVGLYETAVDRLASWEVNGRRVFPKVLASTATVRRARQQVDAVFARQVAIFPPVGLDAVDNFFARQRTPTAEMPGRRYLGLCAFGVPHKTALIRTYGAFLAAGQALYEKYGLAADPWMTLVGYFNSLRELGSMRRAVEDAITTRLRRMDQRGLPRRTLNPENIQELTSRRNATEIPDLLERIEVTFDPARRAAQDRAKGQKKVYPLDVLLATNMISVGVDVPRLGLMVVAGQPKTTAEYIQATSRVGRAFPGLVCTVCNWTRPRDLSHFERFEHYHATFYQHVEALSVTPFAPRALDRGLSALLVALVRLQGPDLNRNERASGVQRTHPYVREAEAAILRRAARSGPATHDLVRRALDKRVDIWQYEAQPRGGARLVYEKRDGVSRGLLTEPERQRWGDFTCLNSLRDVEPSINLILPDVQPDMEENRPWSYPTRSSASAEVETTETDLAPGDETDLEEDPV